MVNLTGFVKYWTWFEATPVLGGLFRKLRYPAKRLIASFQPHSNESWNLRISIVKKCPDNAEIPRVPDAGLIEKNIMTMHNGVKIREGSYYGVGMARLLKENRGVHEPQEERVFAAVLKAIEPGSTIIELGAYWGFYSLWFAIDVANARCVLVEPILSNLEYGRENFNLNGKSAEFVQGFVGASASEEFADVPQFTLDQLCATHGIENLSVLHSDIQGAEFDMLEGGVKMLSNHAVDFVFVSTHSELLHSTVKNKLIEWGYIALADVSPIQSYSDDGILVVRSPKINFKMDFEVSMRDALR
jgi:Methyltransferase FkbM domain